MADTVRQISEILTILADNTSGAISEQDIRDAVVSLDDTGWAEYADTQYTSSSPFAISADTDTILPNNSGSVRDDEMPRDITAMFSGGKITGRHGDGICVTVDFDVVPTSVGTTYIEVWIDIGGAIGALYRRPFSFPKGINEERHISFSEVGYTYDTWEANGGTIYVRANGAADIYNIRLIITRTHRARGSY